MPDQRDHPFGPFGATLRRYRVAARLTQEGLAECAGQRANAIGALERGRRLGGADEFTLYWRIILLMAASLVVVLPVIVLFFFAQRWFISGIALTGIKG